MSSQESEGQKTFETTLTVTYSKTASRDYYGKPKNDAEYRTLVTTTFTADSIAHLKEMLDHTIAVAVLGQE